MTALRSGDAPGDTLATQFTLDRRWTFVSQRLRVSRPSTLELRAGGLLQLALASASIPAS